MGKAAARHLFGYVAIPLALYAVSLWSLSQGGNSFVAVPGLDLAAPLVSQYFGIIFVGGLLCMAALLATVHARSVTDPEEWRFPIVGIGDARLESPRALSAYALVAGLVILTLIIPAAALIHLNRKLAASPVWNEALPAAAQMNVACAMPDFWPFGECGLDGTTLDAFDNAREIKDGQQAGIGRLWLANARCDIVWHMEMAGPQVAKRLARIPPAGIFSTREETARNALSLVGEDAQAKVSELFVPSSQAAPDAAYCAKPGEQSKACKTDDTTCRGVEWRRLGSPALIIAASLAGWGAVAWFAIVGMLWPWRNAKRLPDNRNAG